MSGIWKEMMTFHSHSNWFYVVNLPVRKCMNIVQEESYLMWQKGDVTSLANTTEKFKGNDLELN